LLPTDPRSFPTRRSSDLDQLFVPADFMVPDGLMTGEFRLEPLGPQHNTADYAAWTASIGHIRATPGFAGGSWPHQMSLAENLREDRKSTRLNSSHEWISY